MRRSRVLGERKREGMPERRSVHDEKAEEAEQGRTRQLRSRIPTEVLVELESRCNMCLRLLLEEPALALDVRAYVGWELEYRKAWNVLKVHDFATNRGVAIGER